MLMKLFLLILVSTSFVYAKNDQNVAFYSQPVFLKDQDFDLKKALPPPPKKGSAEEKADFKALHQFEKSRTAEDCAKGNHVVEINLKSYFGKPDGVLTDSEVKALDPFFEKVKKDVGYFTGLAKKHFNRPRPYITDKTLKPCAEKPENAAYPSGHTTIAYVFSGLLTQWDKSRAEQINKRSREISDGRVVVGVHHPSDINAGRKFGKYILNKYWMNTEFMKEFKALPKPESNH